MTGVQTCALPIYSTTAPAQVRKKHRVVADGLEGSRLLREVAEAAGAAAGRDDLRLSLEGRLEEVTDLLPRGFAPDRKSVV